MPSKQVHITLSAPGLRLPKCGFVPHPRRTIEEVEADVARYLSGEDETALQHFAPGHRWRQWADAWDSALARIFREHQEAPGKARAADGDGDGFTLVYRLLGKAEGHDAAHDAAERLRVRFWSDPGRSELMRARRQYLRARAAVGFEEFAAALGQGVEFVAGVLGTGLLDAPLASIGASPAVLRGALGGVLRVLDDSDDPEVIAAVIAEAIEGIRARAAEDGEQPEPRRRVLEAARRAELP